jgi:ABC-type cobalt transport system substrate-binding protein
MKKTVIILVVAAVVLAAVLFLATSHSGWPGVDESVVGHFAAQAGRPAASPLIDIGRGDIALLAFLLAGACGGFILGYQYHKLFAGKDRSGRA